MGNAVEQEIKQGAVKYVILDYPFGRDHPRFAKMIDLSVFIDTPLDIAMARRILRDCTLESGAPAEVRLKKLRDEIVHYLEKSRHVYLESCKHKDTSDLVLDGCRSLEEMRDIVVAHIARIAQY